MKRISRRWLTTAASLAVMLALTTLARGDDPAAATSTTDAKSPGPAPAAAGSAKGPAAAAQDNEKAAVAPSPADAQPPTSPASDRTAPAANREESATSAASTFTPNMIGDQGGSKILRSVLPMPSQVGPVQYGSFNLPPSGIVPSFTSNGVFLTTNATSLYGSAVPGTTFSINNPSNPVLPTAIPLTNTDSAYLSAATQALLNYYKSQNTLTQQISSVTVSPNGAFASETSPHPGSILQTDTFNVSQLYQYQYSLIPSYLRLDIPTPSGEFIGRQRIADDENPLPIDRVFFDYSYFHDAAMTFPSDVNRYVPGFEKTFFDQRMSLEMRFPMGVMESNNIVADSTSFASTGQFGDMEAILKAVLFQEETWALSIGLGVSVPTAPDVNVGLADGTPLVKIANRSTHVLPFFGLLLTPNEDWFGQAYLQIDVAASGDPVYANLAGAGLVSAGEVNDQTQIFLDAMIGRWLYRNRLVRDTSFAAVVEAHYTGGLNSPAVLQAGNFTIGSNNPSSFNVLDFTVGGHAVLGKTIVTAGYSVPATEDRGFQGELRFFVNRRF